MESRPTSISAADGGGDRATLAFFDAGSGVLSQACMDKSTGEEFTSVVNETSYVLGSVSFSKPLTTSLRTCPPATLRGRERTGGGARLECGLQPGHACSAGRMMQNYRSSVAV